jgi:serine/threonine protein kinase
VRDSGRLPPGTPARIGPYRVLHKLGVGGMGLVLMAIRDEDRFKKRVAIKLIKKGMDSEQVLKRFELERQVLSALNHPNIARLLDAGLSEEGQPFFVMEYVEGQTLLEYCDHNALSLYERLELFKKICSAVHYAHTNLVVHRDIKPANILVGKDGEPKLMDFGIVKLLNPDLSGFTMATEPDMRLMTPEYASPEQVEGKPISTVSDVYSLGVLLYELLTGHSPYRFKNRLRDEIIRIVCNDDPVRPSTRITESETVIKGDGTTSIIDPRTIARTRGGAPHRLKRLLAGDIDNIVLKALRKAPKRRYASAEQFAEDIQRHLDGLPVIARPDTPWYRAAKFVGRNKVGVAAAGAIAFLLVWSVVVTTLRYLESERLRKEAVESRDAARRAETDALAARDREAIAKQHLLGISNSFLETLSAAGKGLDRAATTDDLREALLDGAHATAAGIESDASADDDALLLLGRIYLYMGDLEGGARSSGRGNFQTALALYDRAVEILGPLRSSRAGRDALRPLVTAHIRRSDALERLDEPARALDAAKHAHNLAQELAPTEDSPDSDRRLLSIALNTVGDRRPTADAEVALDDYQAALGIRRRLARKNPGDPTTQRDLSVSYSKLGRILMNSERYGEAAKHFADSLEIRTVLAAGDDTLRARRDLMMARRDLADALIAAEDWAAAAPIAQAALDDARALFDADQTSARAIEDLAKAYITLGDVEARLGNTDVAINHYTRAGETADLLRQAQPTHSGARFQWAKAQTSRAQLLADEKHDPNAAIQLFRSARAVVVADAGRNSGSKQLLDWIDQSLQRLGAGPNE